MNLAQALSQGLIAEAKAERREAGPSLEECKRKGTVSVRTHSAELPSAPPDLNSRRERMRGHGRAGIPSATGQLASHTESVSTRILGAIRRAGRPLYWGEIEEMGDIAKGSLGPMVRKLLARGTLTRSGRPKHYLYGLPAAD